MATTAPPSSGNWRREEWWRRFTWASELALDESPAKQTAGLELLTTLAESDLVQRDEALLLDVFQRRLLDTLLNEPPEPERQANP